MVRRYIVPPIIRVTNNYRRYRMSVKNENSVPKSRGKLPVSSFAITNLVKKVTDQ